MENDLEKCVRLAELHSNYSEKVNHFRPAPQAMLLPAAPRLQSEAFASAHACVTLMPRLCHACVTL